MNDNGQLANSQIPQTPPAEAKPGSVETTGESFDAISAVLRLMIGGFLEGADELRRRLRQWEATAHSSPSMAQLQAALQPLQHATVPTSLRYGFIGMLFETQTHMRQRFSTAMALFARLSEETEYLFVTAVEPAISKTPLDPILMRLDEMLYIAKAAVDRWTTRGWLEEQQSRDIVHQATTSVVDELIAYMAHNPELRELIMQQGTSIAGEAVDEVRERTASADMWVERFTRSLLHRPTGHGATVATNAHAPLAGDTGG